MTCLEIFSSALMLSLSTFCDDGRMSFPCVTTQGLSQVEVLTADDPFSLSLKYTRCIRMRWRNQTSGQRREMCISVSMSPWRRVCFSFEH